MPKPHPLKGPNRFKLGVFSTNADGGLAITTVPERWRARGDANLNAVGNQEDKLALGEDADVHRGSSNPRRECLGVWRDYA